MKAFDDWYAKGARTLEATYVLLGLPTLAAAVRPHLKVAGRVGRPSKLPPVDDYPDLVERVRAAGLLPAAEPSRESAAPSDEPPSPGGMDRGLIGRRSCLISPSWRACRRVVPSPTAPRRRPYRDPPPPGPARVLARWRQRATR